MLAMAGHTHAGWTTLTAGELRLTLELTDAGVILRSLLDTRTGRELLAPLLLHPPLPLFEIELRRVNEEGQIEWVHINADSGWDEVGIKLAPSGALIKWVKSWDDVHVPQITVSVRVDLDSEDSAFNWDLDVENNSDWSIWEVAFPQVALAVLGADAKVFFPRGPGEVKELISGFEYPDYHPYPYLWTTMQFLATYNANIRTGLYVATHDPNANTKYIGVEVKPELESKSSIVPEAVPAPTAVVLKFRHPAADMSIAGNGFALSGQAMWQLLRGDWFDAAMIYKEWVRKEAKWFPELTTEGRSDTPLWMRELCVWTRSFTHENVDIEHIVRDLRETFVPYMGLPSGFHWYKWNQEPFFDNDYPWFFPAKAGFHDGVDDMQQLGVFVMPYINGRLWDIHDDGMSTTPEFSKYGKPNATKDVPDPQSLEARIYIEEYGNFEDPCSEFPEPCDTMPVQFAVMCPATESWQNWIKDICLKLFDEYGVNAVYLDVIAAGPPKLCFDETHGHPLGGGCWWVDGYSEMLQSIHGAIPKSGVLTTECNAEPYINRFDGYLTWNWMYNGLVPAFPAVYGGAIQTFGRRYMEGVFFKKWPWPTMELSFQMKAGQQLVFGEQIGWFHPSINSYLGDSPETKEFIRDAVWLRWHIRRYFYAGEMCRPPKLVPEVPPVEADWKCGCTEEWQTWYVTTDAVLTGAWKLPQDDRLALIFVNVSDDPVSTGISFDATDYGIECTQLHVTHIRPEGPGKTHTRPAFFHEVLSFPARIALAWDMVWEPRIDLGEDWNLISLPLQPPDTDPGVVLSSIDGRYYSVWAYDPGMGWSTYIPGFGGNLEKMVAGNGYWINMKQQGTLVFEGTAPESTAIPLRGGKWNLVGYMRTVPASIESCMQNVVDYIDSVWEYSPETGWSVYNPDGASDLKLMKPGYGYWIKADQYCIWDINAVSLP